MLSSFVRNTVKGGKRNKAAKGGKTSAHQAHPQPSPSSIDSFASPDVFDIHEKAHDYHHDANPYSVQGSLGNSTVDSLHSRSFDNSPQVQLDLPENESDWTQELLQCGRGTPTLSSDWSQAIFRRQNGGSPSPKPDSAASGSERCVEKVASSESLRRGPRAPKVIEPEPIVDGTPDLPSAGMTSTDVSSVPAGSTWKKSIPAPIKIPERDRLVPALPVARSNSTIPEHPPREGVARRNTLPSRQPSPISSSDDASAVSGTTLARALIANAFTLSSGDTRSSRYKATMTRQDSATLPRGEQPTANSPYWRDRRISGGEIVLDYESQTGPIVPPVPPVPPGAGAIFLDQKRGASVADKRHSDSQVKAQRLVLTPPPPSNGHDLAFVSTRETSTYVETTNLAQIPELPSPVPTMANLEPPRTANDASSSSPSSFSPPSPLRQAQSAPADTPSAEETSSAPASASRVPLPSSDASEAPTSGAPSLELEFSTKKDEAHRRTHSDPMLSPSPTDHSLDDYQFVPPSASEMMMSASSASGASEMSSSSYAMSHRPWRSESTTRPRFVGSVGMSVPTNRGRIERMGSDPRLNLKVHPRNKKQVTLLPIGDRHSSLMHVPQTPITPGVASLNLNMPGLGQQLHPQSRSSMLLTQQVPTSAVPAGTLEMPLTASRSSTLDSSMFSIPVAPSASLAAPQSQWQRKPVPSRIHVGREDDDLSDYLTMSPESSLRYQSSAQHEHEHGHEHGHEYYPTFPETPQVFTPLYSSDEYYFAPHSHSHGPAVSMRRKGGRGATLSPVVDEGKELSGPGSGGASSENGLTRSITLNFEPGSPAAPLVGSSTRSSTSPRRRSTYEVKNENGSPDSSGGGFPRSPPGVHRRAMSAATSPTTSIRPSPLSHVTTYDGESSAKQQLAAEETTPPASAPSIITTHHDPDDDDDDYVAENSNGNFVLSSSHSNSELSPAAIPLPDSATPSPLPPPSIRSTGSVSPLPTPSLPYSASPSLHSALSSQSQPESFVPNLGVSSVESSPIEYMDLPPPPSEPASMHSPSPSHDHTQVVEVDSRRGSSVSRHSGASSSPSFTPSFIAPPAYHDVVNDRDRPPRLSLEAEEDGQGHHHHNQHHHPQFFTDSPPAHVDQHDRINEHEGVAPHEHAPDHLHPLSAHSNHSEHSNNSPRARIRSRPAMPAGPRKPSGPVQPLGPLTRDRTGSVSSLGPGRAGPGVAGGTSWRKLYASASAPPPKFQAPPLKYRTLTHEAAQWTLSSAQLQEIVSRAIKQTAEATSVRVLRLENLDVDIPEDVHRLELQRTDVKARYKMMMRKRWSLMGTLATHIEGGAETCDAVTAARALEELAEVASALDHLAEELHRVSEQLAQLKSLRDVHAASALAMALRKLNASFLKQVSEAQGLHERIGTLEAERDEAWKHAEDAAQDLDALEERVKAEDGGAGSSNNGGNRSSNNDNGDAGALPDVKPRVSNRRSLRISAVRKSSVRASKAGLRSKRTSVSSVGTRNSLVAPSSGIRSNFSIEDIPPVPPLPLPFGASGMGMGGGTNGGPATRASGMSSAQASASGARALMQAQRELYDMLGLSSPDFFPGQDSPGRPRSASGFVATSSRGASVHGTRPLSEISTGWAAHRPRSSVGLSRSAYSSVHEEERQALLATLGLLDRD
ncbi:hypothetical protein CONPUDRAFT_166449 [Coniophora puteana RWD-64-598 SS2]|uniref:Uncharacterized protein n=1 Tax=Coniophora puteana (strain RWD-64-598) TaxID=741705 RepID=A0A5M3MM30_CONPW|nr:uncharacterized protein CONPUDRAFT_166449 [Coniophora puteana RWD-64-598 SS2]EIW79735.1 hypothetical protein CONPUDRAFT_166449 [Coniophora puteana RWD-64-598 SS2]